MKILLSGFSGYVGSIIENNLGESHEFMGLSNNLVSGDSNHIRCDLRDESAVAKVGKIFYPDYVIHAAGNKDLAFCDKNPKEAFRVNTDATKNLARVFGGKCRIIYISTDYVFDGYKGNYAETDEPNPSTVYGESKLRGEIEGWKICKDSFIILRLSALYDLNATFVRLLREKLSRREPVKCYVDVKYSPTYSRDFIETVKKLLLLKNSKSRVFHSCGETVSRYDFAVRFASAFGFDPGLVKECKYSKRDNPYFFPDLSLSNKMTRQMLGMKTTEMKKALLEMKQGVNK